MGEVVATVTKATETTEAQKDTHDTQIQGKAKDALSDKCVQGKKCKR